MSEPGKIQEVNTLSTGKAFANILITENYVIMSRISRCTAFPIWTSAERDLKEKVFLRLGLSQLMHPTTLNLDHAAFQLLVYMLLESRGKKAFKYPYSLYSKFLSKAGFQAAKKQLIAAGFIEETESNAHRKKPNVYAFSDEWKYKDNA